VAVKRRLQSIADWEQRSEFTGSHTTTKQRFSLTAKWNVIKLGFP